MSAAEQPTATHRTLADIYADRPLTDAQVRRLVALLRLAERPAERRETAVRDAA